MKRGSPELDSLGPYESCGAGEPRAVRFEGFMVRLRMALAFVLPKTGFTDNTGLIARQFNHDLIMNKSVLLLSSILTLGVAASSLQAQQGRPQGAPAQERPDRAPVLGNPVMAAIDADRDGEFSAEEIKNAAAALKTLDKNNDGKLDRTELRPPGRGVGGPGAGGPGGNFGDRIMAMDANKDGKVTKDELPERMQRILQRADTNKDGGIDKAEADALSAQFGGRGQGRPAGTPPGGGRQTPPDGNQ